MAVLRTVIKHRLENLKTKRIAFLAFLVLTTLLIVYSVTLLLQDISIMGKSLEQPRPSYMYTSSLVSSLSSSSPDIEIVFPNSDQTANTECDLEISGISNYDPRNTCHVSVIINDVKPYRKTIPTGGDMKSDYSTWKYVIASDSNTIRQGDNKITARLLCAGENGEDTRKWDSVAVIGQPGSERDSGSLDDETLTYALEAGSTQGISSPTIEIDRNTFVELINKRIGDSSEDIKNSIRDSILSVYTG
ncbi:MAG: hypothetical protein ACM3X1_06020 [Ignavibacteriales bacterium]